MKAKVEDKPISRQAQWERKVKHSKRCVRCGRKRTMVKRYCNYCADLRNLEKRKRYRKARAEVLKAAGFYK